MVLGKSEKPSVIGQLLSVLQNEKIFAKYIIYVNYRTCVRGVLDIRRAANEPHLSCTQCRDRAL